MITVSPSRPLAKQADIVTVALLVKVTVLFECINRLEPESLRQQSERAANLGESNRDRD